MAHTGFWLRGAKGKLAGTTLYRGRTGTVQREIVTPTNPKTYGMMLQRALFAAVAKFYANGQKAFFKFAFENKKDSHTDYNAFMAENAKRGPYLVKNVMDDGDYPMIGLNYTLTKGSLGNTRVSALGYLAREHDELSVATDIPCSESTDVITVADLSAFFTEQGYQDGDIVTVLAITSNVYFDPHNANSFMTFDYGKQKPVWHLKQFIVDSNDLRNVTDLGFDVDPYAVDNDKYCLSFRFPDVFWEPGMDELAIAGAYTVSRQSAAGLKVTNTSLTLNDAALAIAYKVCKELNPSLAYQKSVADSWGAAVEAILQGTLASHAQAVQPVPVATAVRGVATDGIGFVAGMEPQSIGSTFSTGVTGSHWIQIDGENLDYISAEDLTLINGGSDVKVAQCYPLGNKLIINLTATTAHPSFAVRCDKITGVSGDLFKVSFQ